MREGARRRAASKAARNKPDAELKGVKAQLQALADAVLSGDLERADAAVVSQVLNVKLRAELRRARAGARVPRPSLLEFMKEQR
jgi:hypothetical protein